MQTTLVALAVITVGYIFAYLIFDRLRDRYGYVGGAEYVVIGFLLGPRVTGLQSMVRDGADQVREIARGLRPESLEELGLRSALIGLTTAVADRSGLQIVRDIDIALARIDDGTYGICTRCGMEIPAERLDAVPYAVLCVECKRLEERG